MFNKDLIYEIYTYLPYNLFKNLGILNKTLHLYSQRSNCKDLLIKKYVKQLFEYERDLYDILSRPRSEKIFESLTYHTKNDNIIVIKEMIKHISFEEFHFIENAFRIACDNVNIELIDLFLKKYDLLNLTDRLFRTACVDGNLDLVNILIKYPINIFDILYVGTPLELACKNGHLAIVNILLQDDRVDPSLIHNRALRYACEKGHLKVVERLLQDPRVDLNDRPSSQYKSALELARFCNHIEIETLLLSHIN